MKTMLISIDPGTSSSKTGIANWEGCTLKKVQSSQKRKEEKLGWFASSIRKISGSADTVVVEETFYRGPANKTHNRFLGMLDLLFDGIQVIAPTSVKKWVTGSGKSDKDIVKKHLQQILSMKEQKLVDWDDPDQVDAVAIGIAFLRREGKWDR